MKIPSRPCCGVPYDKSCLPTCYTQATPRTAEISKAVQNQNWGFRDMQILAGQLERELNQCVTALKAVANRKTIDDEFDARKLVAAALESTKSAAEPANERS